MDEAKQAGLARLALRLSLGVVFLWFGVDKFINTDFWAMWVPGLVHEWLEALLRVSVFPGLIYLIGVFELVVGFSLILGLMVKYAAWGAAVFLGLVIVTSGVSPVVRDIGLLGIAIYLALTEKKTKGNGLPINGWRLNHKINGRATMLLLALLVVVAVSFTLIQAYPSLNGFDNGGSSSGKVAKKQLLSIVSPSENELLASREVVVRVKILEDLKKLGANHIHVKLDGNVVDVIYLGTQKDEVISELHVAPGRHRLSVFLAYIDHTEFPSSSVSTSFKVSQP